MQRMVLQDLSVRLSVRLSNMQIVTKQKTLVPTFLYHMRDHSPSFLMRRMVGGGRPLLPIFFGQTDTVEAKKSIFNRYSFVVPRQPKNSGAATERQSQQLTL